MAERDGQIERDEREGRDPGQGTTAGTEREATSIEREGMDLLGRSSARDGAIDAVSDPSSRSDQQLADEGGTGARTAATRRNPEQREGAATDEGGLSMSGGAAGGSRGHGGSSDAIESLDGGDQPMQHKSTSRLDLDHGSGAAGG